MENYRLVNESYGNDDGTSSSLDNSIAKNDGRSWNPTGNARNAKKHGKYSEPGNQFDVFWKLFCGQLDSPTGHSKWSLYLLSNISDAWG